MVNFGEMFTQIGSLLAGVMFIWAMFKQYFPHELKTFFQNYRHKLFSLVYPYIQITFNEFTGERFTRNEAFSAIENYLASNSSMHAKKLKANSVKYSKSLALSMDYHEEVADESNGVKVWWTAGRRIISNAQTISFYLTSNDKRYYKLLFHKKEREFVIGPYLSHVFREGKALSFKNRQRKLYTNSGSYWNHVVFQHPATFQSLGMNPTKKQELVDDLVKFSKSQDYYANIGRAWKRGYLLYGPPGTGKSTMIAAIANLLDYDIYDLELTAVKDNTELRKLLIDTSSRSIIVIEDIDCSLSLTGQRKKIREKEEDDDEKSVAKKLIKDEGEAKTSKVTLSGLLNFVDGLWSACGGERLIVFTTNHVEKLDPALIRRGRMDKHVELSYCCFESFKVLAKNYLDIESHILFDKIELLLHEVNMSPADVAENLMVKSYSKDAVDSCLEDLVGALETAKEEQRVKAAEKEEKAKRLAEKAKGKAEEEQEEVAAVVDEESGAKNESTAENGSLAKEGLVQ